MPSTLVLRVPQEELNLDYILTSGQAFRWKKTLDGEWSGVIGSTAVSIRHDESTLICRVTPDLPDSSLLRDYFRLDDGIPDIYAGLAACDPRMEELLHRFRGLRLLRQDPEETLLSFICSAANSIPRISKAIDALSREYGLRIGCIDSQEYYSFPKPCVLLEADESDLRAIGGLGFRGPSLKNVARQILEKPQGWLGSLRNVPYETAVTELTAIHGVGRKIADCVCLFALNKDEAVPVDTHVRQLALRYYVPGITRKTLTPAVYEEISGYFRQRFGRYAGWAQQFLFYEDVLRTRGKLSIGD